MADSGKADDYGTIIGKDATFKGELAFESGVRIDGTLEGKVQTKGRLQVSQDGTLQADVEAGSIAVEGTVKGNLTATDRIEVRKSANITGDLVSARLAVAEGATLTGQVKIGAGAKAQATAAPARSAAPPSAAEGKGEGSKA